MKPGNLAGSIARLPGEHLDSGKFRHSHIPTVIRRKNCGSGTGNRCTLPPKARVNDWVVAPGAHEFRHCTNQDQDIRMNSTLPIDQKTAGYHLWRCLTFLHWKINAEELRPLIPRELSIDQFDGTAWLGLVPFSMERIRPWWGPAVPGISWFLETNVRTYVTDRNGTPGVWFFSLDADQWLAVKLARRFWHLPYEHARLKLNETRTGQASQPPADVHYSGVRTTATDVCYDVRIEPAAQEYSTSPVGSLEHFLLERYVLFASSPNGQLFSGRVHHDPYRFVPAKVRALSQTLTGPVTKCIQPTQPPDHAAFSPGVEVRVSPIHTLTH